MKPPPSVDLESLSLTELIQLQGRTLETLRRRFERPLALAFSDVVNSTRYFAQHGDVAGRGLQQRHLDLLARALPLGQGRVVDTAGDGAFTVFSTVDQAVDSLSWLLSAVASDNLSRPAEHRLSLRVGIHYGPVLTDGTLVSGDAVNLAARVASCAEPDAIRITRAAFQGLEGRWRVRCRALEPMELKGISTPVELLALEWRAPTVYPSRIAVLETGEEHPLPAKEVVTFGRLEIHDGRSANDIVLRHPDTSLALRLSRWHFELRRGPNGMLLRPVSDQMTEVDGHPIPRGTDISVGPDSVIRVARVLTLRLVFDPAPTGAVDPRVAGTLSFTADPRRTAR
jgi:class 3 adenylate cyclase